MKNVRKKGKRKRRQGVFVILTWQERWVSLFWLGLIHRYCGPRWSNGQMTGAMGPTSLQVPSSSNTVLPAVQVVLRLRRTADGVKKNPSCTHRVFLRQEIRIKKNNNSEKLKAREKLQHLTYLVRIIPV